MVLSELNRRITAFEYVGMPEHDLWAKVDYHKVWQIQKTNIVFTIRARPDLVIVPGWTVRYDGYDYEVHNVSKVSALFTVLECDLPTTLKPPP
jgi:hypothetical protein